MRRRHKAWMFDCVRTEGALLPPDLLAKVAALDARLPGVRPVDYHLDEGERIADRIAASWSALLGRWAAFKEARLKLDATAGETETGTRLTRERWLLPLFQELGYGRLVTESTGVSVGDRTYDISHLWHHSPIHLLGYRVDLERSQKGVAGAASASPHGLLQDFLNRSENHQWGFVSNGLLLRLLRDNYSLTRQAYVEFDLQAIMDGEEFAEFSLLWLVCHQSRVEGDKPADCILEKWCQYAREEGVEALNDLRIGVQKAIEALGAGFLRCRDNQALQMRLQSRALDRFDYFRQLLRLVYRLIFLFVVEDRDLLLAGADAKAKDRYRKYYGTARIRRLAEKRRGTPHVDLWRGLRLLMSKMHGGCSELGLPALGSHLWNDATLPDLATADLTNEDLLVAVRSLCFLHRGGVRRTVNWRAIGAQELGSVYESLLDYHADFDRSTGEFKLRVAAGNERKTTGSYYTPESLVSCLLETALDPVLERAAGASDAEAALLNLKVCDPACGSGHFLVAAAHRIAKRLAMVRSGDDEPSPEAQRHALRDVAGRCLFGVDINAMAVELCKVSLWLEAHEPGRPLSFLDAHIQCGNSLLGTTPALMAKGIPNEAFSQLQGDDQKVTSALRRQNRQESGGGQTTLFAALGEAQARYGEVEGGIATVEAVGDGTLADIKEKEVAWNRLAESPAYREQRFLAHAWSAAFVWPKTAEWQDFAITTDLWRRLQKDQAAAPERTRQEVERLAAEYQFLHFHLAFPQVFRLPAAGRKPENEICGWDGGFDVVLGNPPWERLKLQEKEFFAERSPRIAEAANADARKKMIEALPSEDPALWEEWKAASRRAEGESALARLTGRYPLCGRGDINTYAVFAELNRALISAPGRVGCILPSGIAMDDTTKFFFQALVNGRELASLYHFENEEFVFPAVHHAVRFCLLCIAGSASPVSHPRFVAYARQVSVTRDPERIYTLTAEDFALINPNTLTFPAFRLARDAEITKGIHRRVPVLVKEGEPEVNPWGVTFQAMFHMANDSGSFRTRQRLEREGWRLSGNVFEKGGGRMLPLYEAKMVHHFDHRFGSYEGQTQAQANQGKLPETTPEQHANPNHVVMPRYWVAESEVDARLEGKWNRAWCFAWRRIARSSDERTFIAAPMPKSAVGDSLFLLLFDSDAAALLIGCLSSYVFDYACRTKLGGTNVSFFVVRQLPVLPPEVATRTCPWANGELVKRWFEQRVAELSSTSMGFEGFGVEMGLGATVATWTDSRRFLLRAELDAAFFHLYGIARDDVDHIMDSFWVVRDRDIVEHGRYRTKEKILEIYDALKQAMDTGHPYVTVLDPPPADPRLAFPPDPGERTPKALP